jgi:hypothetical protein
MKKKFPYKELENRIYKLYEIMGGLVLGIDVSSLLQTDILFDQWVAINIRWNTFIKSCAKMNKRTRAIQYHQLNKALNNLTQEIVKYRLSQ